jgi:hypothetical protein
MGQTAVSVFGAGGSLINQRRNGRSGNMSSSGRQRTNTTQTISADAQIFATKRSCAGSRPATCAESKPDPGSLTTTSWRSWASRYADPDR